MTRLRLAGTLGALGLAAFGMLAPACGGGPDAKVPKGAGSAPADGGTGGVVTSDQGQQVGISAGPDAHADLTGSAKDAYDKAFQAWMNGDLQGAKSGFSDAASKAPSAGSPHYSLGCVLERLGDTAGAQQEYRKAFENQPTYEVAMGALALSLARTGHAGEADTFLTDKHQKSPDSLALTTFLAEVKSIAGDSVTAQKLAQDALTKQSDYKPAMMVIARDYYRVRRFDVALYALGAILDGSPDGSIPARDKDNPEARMLRGLIERQQGNRKQAMDDFAAAVAKRPDLFEAYVNLGEMKLEAGNATEAQTPLEKAVRYAPNSAIAHLDLGDCYRLLGRTGDAKKELETSLAQDSSLANIHYDLGLLYLFTPFTASGGASVPGVSSADDQLAAAIKELEMFKTMRGAKPPRGQGDDIDELLSTAKRKQGELKVKNAPPPPPPPSAPAGAGSGASPAGGPSSAPAPAGSAPPAASAVPTGSSLPSTKAPF